MTDGSFDHVLLDGGVIEATFHAMTIQPGPQFAGYQQVTTGSFGVFFAIIRNGTINEKCDDQQIFGGYAILEGERFQRLGCLPIGNTWTALKVRPQICDGDVCKLCTIDLRMPERNHRRSWMSVPGWVVGILVVDLFNLGLMFQLNLTRK